MSFPSNKTFKTSAFHCTHPKLPLLPNSGQAGRHCGGDPATFRCRRLRSRFGHKDGKPVACAGAAPRVKSPRYIVVARQWQQQPIESGHAMRADAAMTRLALAIAVACRWCLSCCWPPTRRAAGGRPSG